MHVLNLIASCSSSKKWQMTLVRQNDGMYVAVWSANCSRVLSCQCYILIKNYCDNNWCFRSFAAMEPVCSLPSSHKLHFLTTGLETVSPDSLCDIPQYLQCHDHSPTCTLAYTPSSSPVQGVWPPINRTQAVVFMSDIL